MSEAIHTKVLIIGSGPAGYTAGIYAARANLNPLIVTGLDQGGQLMITTDVENYPGFADVIQGPWLMEQMKLQAEHVGTKILNDYITRVDLSARPFKAYGDSGTLYTGDTLIIATGAKARWLGLESEATFRGKGVSACATCDGFFFRGKDVAIVGGGNTAVEEALFLTNFCNTVTLIHRRDSLKAEKILQQRLFENPKIEPLWDSVVEEILGNESGMTGLKVKNVKTGATSTLEKNGLFVAIGHDPATDLFKGLLDMDAGHYITTAPDSTATSVPGVFAAGDVTDSVYRQAVTAAGLGCMAALEADRFLAHQEKQSREDRAAE
ncbi:MAG: thioredoxin-disulfide reductase [Rhodospirillales bacterium]|nr:thioredoxin-disulfide reductase [Rhodospirillales bacterium]